MGFRLIQFVLLAAILIVAFRFLRTWLGSAFSNNKVCPRCEGKGYWLNTRNRETCEWCQGSGRLPKGVDLD